MKTDRHPALMEFGKQLRRNRKLRGFSQEGFADAADIDRSYYGGIERGERNVSTLNLMRIAVALEMEVGELFPATKDFRNILENKLADKSER